MKDYSLQDILVHDRPMSAVDWAVDVVIALGAFGFGCLQLTLSVNLLIPDEALRRFLGIEAVVPTVYAITAVALTTAPLVLRRRYPWPVFVVSVVMWMLFQAQIEELSLSLIGPFVALFTLTYTCARNEALAGAAIVVLVILTVPSASSSATLASLSLVQNIALAVAVSFAGYALQTRQDYLRAAEERAAEAERTRESEAERRVEAERVRIAREVHDITAHSLSAVSIQAAAAERLIDADPAAAKEAIAAVRQTSKTALEDMRAMIGVLRSGGEGADTAPTEGTDRMGDLAAYLRDGGVECELDMGSYDRAAVPAHVDVALFGIAREACTNIVRHAHARHAQLTLRSNALVAELAVQDDGCGFVYDPAKVAGHGLEGMRERAHVLGGSFETPRVEGCGFCIRVSIPFGAKEGDGAGNVRSAWAQAGAWWTHTEGDRTETVRGDAGHSDARSWSVEGNEQGR